MEKMHLNCALIVGFGTRDGDEQKGHVRQRKKHTPRQRESASTVHRKE